MVQMAHLAAAPRFPLAVELWPDACAQPGRNRGDLVADEVFHHYRGEARRVAQRPAGNRPDVLLELIRYADCFGPMPGIMDSRGYLVDQQRLAGNEELDAEHADIIEGTGNAPRRGDRLCRRLGAYSRRDSAGVEDMAAVDVLRRFEGGDGPVAAARHDDRYFLVERHEGFQHQRLGFERGEGRGGVDGRAKNLLALAVIAEPRRLQHCRRAERRDGGFEVGEAPDSAIGRDRDALRGDE